MGELMLKKSRRSNKFIIIYSDLVIIMLHKIKTLSVVFLLSWVIFAHCYYFLEQFDWYCQISAKKNSKSKLHVTLRCFPKTENTIEGLPF